MDWLTTLFLGAFLFGLLFCAASVLLGLGHPGIGHHGLHLHGGHGAGAAHELGGGHGAAPAAGADGAHVPGWAHGYDAAHAGSGGHGSDSGTGSAALVGISPWNVTGLTAFVAWFGGVGYLARTGWELAAWAALLLAAAAGLIGWWGVYLFFTRFLLKGDRAMDPSDYRLEGTVARVTVPITGGRTGEIQYTKEGVRHSDGARSINGAPLEHGAEVVIVRYERGIAYVQPWEAYVQEEAR